MPKIDWAPGAGRRGRPIRRVVGMGQKQGLIVLCALFGLSVLVAGYAAIGGFDQPAKAAAGASGGAYGSGADGASGGSGGAPAANTPADPAAASKVLQASTQHYADVFAQGQKIVGHTRYADQAAYGKAFSDAKSPAAQFSAYRISPNPEADASYSAAATAARKKFGSHRPSAALGAWSTDMVKAKTDLSAWVGVAVRFQTGGASQGDLDAAAAKVTADLAAAKADAVAAGG
jgi:hypothetical protein